MDGRWNTCPDWFDVGQRLRQGCSLAPLMSHLSVAAKPTVARDECREDENVMADMIKATRSATKGKRKNGSLVEAVTAISGLFRADDADIAPHITDQVCVMHAELALPLNYTVHAGAKSTRQGHRQA